MPTSLPPRQGTPESPAERAVTVVSVAACGLASRLLLAGQALRGRRRG